MTSSPQDRIYWRTPAGDEAVALPDVTIPSDYRRVLRAIGRETHVDVVRGRLRQFPDSLLFDWLAEPEETGYIGSRLADYTQDPDFEMLLKSKPEGPTAPEDAGAH